MPLKFNGVVNLSDIEGVLHASHWGKDYIIMFYTLFDYRIYLT